MLHAFWSDYHRFFLYKRWHLQLMYWKMQFCCSPRVWHLHAFLKPHRGFLYEPPSLKGGAKISAALPKKNDKCPIDGRGMGTPGIDWAIITCHYGLGELSPLERVITSRYAGDYLDYFALLHQCVEKSDLGPVSRNSRELTGPVSCLRLH